MKLSANQTWQTVVIAFFVVGIIALALGGYLTPVTRLAMQPFISAQTWIATRYSDDPSFVEFPPRYHFAAPTKSRA